MYVILLKVVFLIIFLPILKASLDLNLIVSFFAAKSLRFGYVFDCMSNKERVRVFNFLMKNQLRISQSQIQQCSSVFSNILTNFPHHCAVIMDADCNNVDYLMKQFGSAAVYITSDRVRFLDFARGLWMFRSIFIFRRPTKRTFKQIFLHPMSTSVWILTSVAGIIIILTLRFIQVAEFKILTTVTNSVEKTWSSVVLFVLGTFCQQGTPLTSYLLSARIITVYILLFCLLFYQFYSGSIVSNLLTKPPTKIKELQDLLESDLKVGSDDVPYIRDYFRSSTDPTVLEFYQRKFLRPGNHSNYFPLEHGLELVEKGGFAYQVDVSAAYPIIENTFSDEAICELGEVKMFPISLLMPPIQKHSPFRDMLNYCFYRQIEHGINERQKKHWGASKPQCMESRQSIKFHVAFTEIYPALVLLGFGMLLSLIILAIEMFMNMWISRSNRTFLN